ncbi:hypothetical protein SAMN02910358_01500 [Lachnospiraceae bacterium XBB1006]|nr:hypothetical protein SAMN02910358_01500 [Lachnospiraceae bacterium XBB1006]
MTNLGQIVNNQLEMVKRERNELERKYAQFPPGKLLIAKDRKWEKWYCSFEGKRTLIPKKEKAYAEQLAKKRYCDARLKDLQKEQAACEAYLRRQRQAPASAQYRDPANPYWSLIFSEQSTDPVQQWYRTTFMSNPEYPEQRIHKASSGHFLRSKSEVLIDEMLSRHKLMFHYEEMLIFSDGSYYYPDFKIYSPKTEQFIIWEHFGKMDDHSYAVKTYRKIDKYIGNGYLPQKNLLLTFETKRSPLDYEYVEMLIEKFFVK